MLAHAETMNCRNAPDEAAGRFICRICGNVDSNKSHVAQNLWARPSKEYIYIECGACGCLQIATYPDDIESIYPEDYYVHTGLDVPRLRRVRNWLRSQWIDYGLTGTNPLGWILGKMKPLPRCYKVAGGLGLRKTSSVLDVGCGSGVFLLWLARAGFTTLAGIDLYIPCDVTLPGGIRLLRRSIFEETGEYDCIVLMHSFEHMPEPAKVLERVRSLLREGGVLVISVPLLGYSWNKYGTSWWNLDAPRHFYLHTRRSLQRLFDGASFEVRSILYDSTYWQFVGSELLAKGFTRREIEHGKAPVAEFFDQDQISLLIKRARELNRSSDGDQAALFLMKGR